LNTGRIDLERFLRVRAVLFVGHMYLISPSVAQTTRVLAEEQFMKRALIEKIQVAVPMGMSLPYS